MDLCAKCKKDACPHRRKIRELPKKSQGPRQHCAEYHKDNEYEKTTIIVVTEIGDKKTNRGTASGVMCPKCRKTLVDMIKNNDAIKRTQS